MQILVRRYGTIIDVTTDGESPTPKEIVDLLVPHMVYEHKTLLRGIEAYKADAQIKLEGRELFEMVQQRLTTGYGYIPLIGHVLSKAGHDVRLLDMTPPRPREGCYTPDWNHLYQHIRPFTQASPDAHSFRPRQEECLVAMNDNQGGIIDAVPGFGKTFLLAAHGLLYPKANIHIVIKPVDVAKRIARQLSQFLPSVGLCGGGFHERGRMQIYTADSLHHSDGDADWLICDEAHQLMSETYSRELGRIYRWTRNYAMTATPDGRLDGAHAKLHMFFGPIIFQLQYPEAVQLGLVVPIIVRWLSPLPPDNVNPAAGKSGVPRLRWGIWRNQWRNAAFATDARTYTDDTQVLMLCETIDHAVHLWQHLPEFQLCYGAMDEAQLAGFKKQGMLPHEFAMMDPARREWLRASFERGDLKKVIATDVWSTGVDFAALRVLYRCDARESEILSFQGPGRVSRVFEGKDYGEVIDSIDNFDPRLRAKAGTRHRHYAKRGWDQIWPGGRRQISHEH